MDSRSWSEVDLAWMAGLLEGEGSFTLGGSKGTYKNGSPRKLGLRITCGSTDLDVVEKLHALAGIGNVSRESRKDKRRDHAKPFWVWTAFARMDVVPYLEAIRPYMGSRRGSKIDELLAYHRDNPLVYNVRAGHGTVTRFRSGCRCSECEPLRSGYNKIQNERYYARREEKRREEDQDSPQ